MQVLSYPLRFGSGKLGEFAKVDYGSDRYKADQILALIRTDSEERPIFRDFGISDPTFSPLTSLTDEITDRVVESFAQYYEDIEIAHIEVAERQGAPAEIIVHFR